MPLYAFDGTWNLDKPGTEHDTNVVWFHDAYTGPKHYFKRIGTRLGALGHIVGGINGAGGRDRVEEALAEFEADQRRGDPVVDAVGFSPGAALALEFPHTECARARRTPSLRLWNC